MERRKAFCKSAEMPTLCRLTDTDALRSAREPRAPSLGWSLRVMPRGLRSFGQNFGLEGRIKPCAWA
jgi:hypothetical protein